MAYSGGSEPPVSASFWLSGSGGEDFG